MSKTIPHVAVINACDKCGVEYEPEYGAACTEFATYATDQQIVENRAPYCGGQVRAIASPDDITRAIAIGGQRERDRINEAIWTIIDQGGDPVSLRPYRSGHCVLACCVDERVAGQFIVAAPTYVEAILRSASEAATPKRRDEISDENIAAIDALIEAAESTPEAQSD